MALKRLAPSNGASGSNKRHKPEDYTAWGWVGHSVTDESQISSKELLLTCGLYGEVMASPCVNAHGVKEEPAKKKQAKPVTGELAEDVIVIDSDDEGDEKKPAPCSKKLCKTNPNCLNYLGQDKWEDEVDARKMFMKQLSLGIDPSRDTRVDEQPVGLKNLGATCYANALLQVWYQDRAFRSGVYQCQPSQDKEHAFEESPIFQLQATFAALQESVCDVFNPAKLVESLKLRTTEQQDAQEFSKLFMSHLDAEFKKQSIPSLRSLIADQFEGTQEYGTECSTCHWSSPRPSDFLEIEISFNKNCSLLDRLKAYLEPELMTGDNKYLCPRCDSLQDASRYTKIRKLPPVLHFSLLRFVYDISSGERRKSKHSVGFPKVLDMRPFVTKPDIPPNDVIDVDVVKEAPSQEEDPDEYIYELRGVLVHKGASAYHGHYEAEVFDTQNDDWYQFNDEIVIKMKPRGTPVTKPEDESPAKAKNAGKRQRVMSEDEDDDIEVVDGPSSSKSTETPKKTQPFYPLINSRDAYMLVYCRRERPSLFATPPPDLTPPPRARGVIQSLNTEHQKACEEFKERRKEGLAKFAETRRRVMDIYNSWKASPSVNALIVSRQALEKFLSQSCIMGAMAKTSEQLPTPPAEAMEVDALDPSIVVSNQDIVCEHGKLDPHKAADMKRISQKVYQNLVLETNCTFSPKLMAEDVCVDCVKSSFSERLYKREHQRVTKDVDAHRNDPPAYWISKAWYSDWKLVRPKMHVEGNDDPAPDSDEYNPDTYCSHGGLIPDRRNRIALSQKGYEALQELYPDWIPIRHGTANCEVCESEHTETKGTRDSVKQQAGEEKLTCRHMHENAMSGRSFDLSHVFLIPATFARAWKEWVQQPHRSDRPGQLDNSVLRCVHDGLPFDPNVNGDMAVDIVAIKPEDWNQLVKRYGAGPSIELRRDPKDKHNMQWVASVKLCKECRVKSKRDFSETNIHLIRISSLSTVPTGRSTESPTNTVTSQKQYGTRHSTRLQTAPMFSFGQRRKIVIAQETTVLDIKKQIDKAWSLSPICQRLFYAGKELDDNSVTVNELCVEAYDAFYVQDVDEDEDELVIENDPMTTRKKPREEERGFAGTFLGGGGGGIAAPSKSSTPEPVKNNCKTCTFENAAEATECEMCAGKL